MISLGGLEMIGRWYLKCMKTRPWTTQAITTGIIMGIGDIISQTIIEKKERKQIEVVRIARFALVGSFFVGPTLKVWYTFLEKYVGAKGTTVGLKKMLLDQSIFAPIFLFNFLTIMGILQKENFSKIKERLQQDYLTVLKSNYTVWPAVQLVTFYVVPFQFRIIFVNTVAVFWNSYLSWKSNRSNFIIKSEEHHITED